MKTSSIKLHRLAAAVAACVVAAAAAQVAHAQSTEAPTVIANSNFDINAVMDRVKSEAQAGKELTGSLKAGWGPFSADGSLAKMVTAMSTSTLNGVVDLAKGTQMTGTSTKIKAVQTQVDNVGGEVANGVVRTR